MPPLRKTRVKTKTTKKTQRKKTATKEITSLPELIKVIGNKNVYMVIGHDSKNQIKNVKDVIK